MSSIFISMVFLGIFYNFIILQEQPMPVASEACTGNNEAYLNTIQSSVMPKHEYCGQEGAIDKY